jgi:hypothetical protein
MRKSVRSLEFSRDRSRLGFGVSLRAALALLVAATGCSGSAMESNVEDELVVTVTADRSSVARGQEMRVTVRAVNNAAAERTLQFSSACLTGFEFLNSNGQIAGESTQMCAQVLTRKTLAPGGEISEIHVWSRDDLGLPQLAPGLYRLRGVLLTTPSPVRSAAVPVDVP